MSGLRLESGGTRTALKDFEPYFPDKDLTVLMPDPKVLRACLARFTDAHRAHAQNSRPGTEQELRDTAYTLCVMTGTRSVREALTAADLLLARPALSTSRDPEAAAGEDLPVAA